MQNRFQELKRKYLQTLLDYIYRCVTNLSVVRWIVFTEHCSEMLDKNIELKFIQTC